MVRLQRNIERIILISVYHFQSHYGAIATCIRNSGGVVSFDGFQSHYGAIATTQPPSNTHTVYHFQSHYGAIATINDVEVECPYIITFNPTMVRLQPQMREGVGDQMGNRFQSHYGAIATVGEMGGNDH